MEWLIYLLGALVIGLFLYLLFRRKTPFDAPLLGLLTLGISLIAIAALKPGSMKFANVELAQIWTKSQQASDDAQRARKLSAETTAFLFWNGGRLNKADEFQQKVARQVLREVYGDQTDKLIHALQHKQVFVTPPNKLKLVPNDPIPSEINSPMLTSLGKWTSY